MFDYGNARLHAMKSRLLSRDELERLAEAGSLQGLIAALTNTPYRKAVEIAITYTTGMGCIHEALRVDLVTQLQKIRQFTVMAQASWWGSYLGITISIILKQSSAAWQRTSPRVRSCLPHCRSVI